MRLASCLCILVLGVSACGSDETTTVTTKGPSGPSKAEFVAKVDRICQRMVNQTRPLGNQVEALADMPTPERNQQAADLIFRVSEIQRLRLAEFEALTPPPGDEATAQKFFDSIREQADLGGLLAEASSESDFDRFNSLLDQLTNTRARSDGLAEGYGFDCPSS